jgi:hypothetical protein
MRKRMRDKRNSSSMLSLCVESAVALRSTHMTCLQPLCRIRAIAQVDQDLAHLRFEEQGVCDAAERFLGDVDIGIVKGIAAQCV